MTAPSIGDWATVPFRKPSRSSTNSGECVEVGARPGLVAVRDSKSPESAWSSYRPRRGRPSCRRYAP